MAQGHESPNMSQHRYESPNMSQAMEGMSQRKKMIVRIMTSANAVVTQEDCPEGCWSVDIVDSIAPDSDEDEDIIDESDWFCEVDETAAAVITPLSDGRAERIEMYDSGATRHLSPYRSDFTTYAHLDTPIYFNAANQQKFAAVGIGSLAIHTPNGLSTSTLTLHDVLHSPSVGCTLVSLGALDKRGYRASLGSGHLELFAPGGERVCRIPRNSRGLYRVVHSGDAANSAELMSVMEHIAPASARALVEKGLVTGIKLDPNLREGDCDACIFARATRRPVPKVRVGPQAQNFGEEIHSDVWGPSQITSKGGRRYFITFTDDVTRYTVTYLLRNKSEAFGAYKGFEAWAVTQQHCTAIKVLRSDRGGEYLSGDFDRHLAAAGTSRRLTVHDTPQLNGVAECLNRTIAERVRAFTHTSSLPETLWGEALRHATWLKNRTATCALDGLTPYQALFGRAPDLSGLQRWGAKVWVHDDSGDKLDVRAREGHWLGFDIEARGHHVYFLTSRSVATERNVYFGTAPQLEGEDYLLIPSTEHEQRAAPTSKTFPPAPVPAPAPLIQPATLPPQPPTMPPAPPPRPPPPLPPVQTTGNWAPRSTTPPSPLTPLTSSSDRAQSDDEVERALDNTPRPKRVRKPSRTLRQLMEGVGVSSTRRSDPQYTPGTQLPGGFGEEIEEAGGVCSAVSAFDELEDSEWLEHILATETADAEALEPRSLAEAKRRPD
jgi:transposase InsO family protein